MTMKPSLSCCLATLFCSLIAACGSSSKIPTASCQHCGISAALCAETGAAAGCKQSSFIPSSGSQCASCSFSDCDAPPTCESASSYAHDAGSTKDASVDPACKAADPNGDGLFTSTPPCANPKTVQINGATSYTCPCGTCPCGYQCGSIALSVGGVISSVCAPPKP